MLPRGSGYRAVNRRHGRQQHGHEGTGRTGARTERPIAGSTKLAPGISLQLPATPCVRGLNMSADHCFQDNARRSEGRVQHSSGAEVCTPTSAGLASAPAPPYDGCFVLDSRVNQRTATLV